ncbi:MAG: PQQ-dependent sugar dehydrogenase [Beijerinckiaceae bacterium]|nr:PQQ-dependent sugar dehydrogenase [Beijerinckiaceae bacterium]
MRSRLVALFISALAISAPFAQAQEPRTLDTSAGRLSLEVVARGLENPWGLAFLPDGRMLVTEKAGRLRIVTQKGDISPPIANVPRVAARGQGGLLDVAVSPAFAKDRTIFLSFSEAGDGGVGTALARARLANETELSDVRVIFRQTPKVEGGQHFGSRIVFARDGAIFLTTGDRGKFDPAQDLSKTIGVVARLNGDGSPLKDNPFVGQSGARPEIFSYGHRNIQGAAIHPRTGALWVHEMGPRGGDEINIVLAGRNYGWPLVSWGDHYSGVPIARPTTRPDLAASIHHWTPSIAPSGMAFYESDLIAPWRGSLLVGALAGRMLVRLTFEGEKVVNEERIALNARIRDVRVGPDGAIYAITDATNGRLLRLSPAR